MNLVSLSSDAIHSLTGWLNGFDIMALWSCGNSELNQKVAKGGGVRSFKKIMDPSKPEVWPSFLPQLMHLTELIIEQDGSSTMKPLLVPNLLALPQTLQVIRFSFENDFAFVRGAFSKASTGNIFANLHTLHCDGMAGYLKNPLEGEGLQWPKQLLDLSLGCADSNSRKRYEKIDIGALPTTLTRLRVATSTLTNATKVPFGNALIDVDLTFSDYWNVSEVLPRSLKSLSLRILRSVSNTSYPDWKDLPSSLSSLSLDARGAVWADEDSFDFSGIPASVQRLNIKFLSISAPGERKYVVQLPRHLQGTVERFIEWEAVSAMPPTSTYIYTRRNTRSKATEPKIDAFPLALKELTIDFITPEVAALLPQTLQKLTLEFGAFTSASLQALPKLKVLENVFGQAFATADVLQHIPPSVEEIELVPSYYQDQDTVLANPLSLPDESALWFPRHLRHLGLGYVSLQSAQWFAGLPTTHLTSLRINATAIPEGTMAALSAAKFLTRLEFRCLPADIAHIIAPKPTSLTALSISFAGESEAESDLTNDHLKQLPPFLTSLELPKSPALTQDCVVHLPTTIREFSVAEKTPKWYNLIVKKRTADAYTAFGLALASSSGDFGLKLSGDSFSFQ